MADENIYQWLLGGGALAMGAGFIYLLNKTGQNSDDLAAHKTLIAEKYLTKDDYTLSIAGVNKNIDRIELALRDGNKANLESNEKIRSEVSQSTANIINIMTSSGKITAEMNSGNAAIIAAIGASKGN